MFSHPLARLAKVWIAGDGSHSSRILVIITTLALDPKAKRYAADKVARLSDAAREWIAAHAGEADTFMLINRAKDW